MCGTGSQELPYVSRASMKAGLYVVGTQVLCTDHAISMIAICRLMALIIGAVAEDHLQLSEGGRMIVSELVSVVVGFVGLRREPNVLVC